MGSSVVPLQGWPPRYNLWEDHFCVSQSERFAFRWFRIHTDLGNSLSTGTYQTRGHGPWRSAWEPTWLFAKVPEVAHYILHFYLRAQKRTYFHSMSSGFWDMCRFSKLPHLGMKLGHSPRSLGHSPRSYTYIGSPFLPQGADIELIFALRATVSEIRADFQNCHIWA